MPWSPTKETLEAYLSVMTEEQFEKLEDIILGLKKPDCFTMAEVRELEIKLQEQLAKNRNK